METGFRVNDKYDLKGRATARDSSISRLSTEDAYFYAPTSNETKDAFKEGTMTIKLKPCTSKGDIIKIGNDYIAEYTLNITA